MNNSRILDDILSIQKPSGDKSGVGYAKVNKLEYSSFTKQGGNRIIYEDALKSPVKKEESKRYVPSFHDRYRTNEVSKRPMTNRYQNIFLGHCYSCNSFGHKAMKCRAYGKVYDIRRICLENQKEEIISILDLFKYMA